MNRLAISSSWELTESCKDRSSKFLTQKNFSEQVLQVATYFEPNQAQVKPNTLKMPSSDSAKLILLCDVDFETPLFLFDTRRSVGRTVRGLEACVVVEQLQLLSSLEREEER